MKVIPAEKPYIEAALHDLRSQTGEAIGLDSFKGFSILLPESDEFLAAYDKKAESTAYKWVTGSPDQAVLFPRMKRAHAVALLKEGAETVMLFESSKRYYVMEVQQ